MEWSNEIERYHYSSQFYGFVFSSQSFEMTFILFSYSGFFDGIESDYVDGPLAVLFHGIASTSIVTRSKSSEITLDDIESPRTDSITLSLLWNQQQR